MHIPSPKAADIRHTKATARVCRVFAARKSGKPRLLPLGYSEWLKATAVFAYYFPKIKGEK